MNSIHFSFGADEKSLANADVHQIWAAEFGRVTGVFSSDGKQPG